MLGVAAVTALCTGAIAFYVRFLVALFRDCKPGWVGYWARLRRHSGESSMPETHEHMHSVSRAA